MPSTVTHPEQKTTYTVKSIGEKAFYECSGLTSVSLPSSVTSFGGYAFAGCSSLTTLTIPSSVTSIVGMAFYTSGLSSVTANMTTPFAFGGNAFGYIDSNCRLYVPQGTKAAYIAKGWTEDVFPGGVFDGTEVEKGDINGDGDTNISDVTSLVNMVLGKTTLNAAADLNGDGEVNISDVTTSPN